MGQPVGHGLDAPIHTGAHVQLRHLLHLLQVRAGRTAVETWRQRRIGRGGRERGSGKGTREERGKSREKRSDKGVHGI
jgi:hypothetical protein